MLNHLLSPLCRSSKSPLTLRGGTVLLTLLAMVGSAHAQNPVAANDKADTSTTALPHVTVHKDPNCGCCKVWGAHLRESGFKVTEQPQTDMAAIKRKLGVPEGKYACHTAEVGGYVIEGHVPAADIKRLLKQRPNAKGLTVPGMPLGSPGMEVPGGQVDAYTVELFKADGSVTPFARHGGDTPPTGK